MVNNEILHDDPGHFRITFRLFYCYFFGENSILCM